MASRDGGGLSSAQSQSHFDLRRDSSSGGDSSSDSESDSSYAGSGFGDASPVCRYRTQRFHDQECARYFDCPTHVVERVLSDGEDGDGSGDEEAGAQVDVEQEHQEQQGDLVATGVRDDPSPEAGPRPVEDQDVHGVHASSAEASSPSPRAPTAGDEATLPVQSIGSGEASGAGGSNTASAGEQRPRAPSGSQESPIVLDDEPVQPQGEQPDLSRQGSGQGEGRSRSGGQSPIIPSATRPPLIQISRAGRETESAGTIPGPGPLYAAPNALPTSPSSSVQGPFSPPGPAERRRPLEFVLPRWQPDAEVTYCPICHTQFSIFVRKHHCRYVLLFQRLSRASLICSQKMRSRCM